MKKRVGRKSAAQTPAPKSDRKRGSKINPKGSASSKSRASSIKFSNTTNAQIKSILDKHNEKYPRKKVALATARAVVRRGMGAFSVSHRPNVGRTQWGLARLKTFLTKKRGGTVKKSYIQDDDLLR